MNAITLRNRWLTTYRHMQDAVQPSQRALALSKPAPWKRLFWMGWVIYRATIARRGRNVPGLAFDVCVTVLLLVLLAANLIH